MNGQQYAFLWQFGTIPATKALSFLISKSSLPIVYAITLLQYTYTDPALHNPKLTVDQCASRHHMWPQAMSRGRNRRAREINTDLEAKS